MGADPARDGGKAGLNSVCVSCGELNQDLPLTHGFTNTTGNGFDPASARRGEAEDSLHRLQHHKHIAAGYFLTFACQ